MNKTFSVRVKVVLATVKQWPQINKISVQGIFQCEPEDFLEVIGLVGAKTAITNDEENEFFDLLHKLNRELL